MAKAKIVFKLDETDQIEVHGHTLSRLIIDGFKIGGKDVTYFPQASKSYKSKDQHWIMAKPVGSKGGYIDSLDNISTNVTNSGLHAWLDEDSWAYESTIGPAVHIIHSNIIQSTIQFMGLSMHTAHNPFEHRLVRAFGEINNSVVKASTLINVSAYDSEIKFSDVKRVTAYDSTISRSSIEMKKQHWITKSSLNTVSGTFNNDIHNTDLLDVQFGTKTITLEKNNGEFLTINIDDKIFVVNNNTSDYTGDSVTVLGTLSYYINNVTDWTDESKKMIKQLK